ncbi:acylamino-acid-releasing enzyme isoform X4 [Cuculus canorus]|uniref:acylamino-acid-releasing enzyme isoform X4 n=1 Tax=Cuculus canorus TaxID=55661 RepID=UPI0023AA8378|nr:acylamino-acid-releasing enzyme isoform X4 [Cuculus canorus]
MAAAPQVGEGGWGLRARAGVSSPTAWLSPAQAAGSPTACYQELSRFPTITRAALRAAAGAQTFLLYTECSRPDPPRRRPLRFSRHYSLWHTGDGCLAACPAALSAEIHNQLLSQDSPTGRHRAVLSRCPRQGHELLEVWSSSGRSHSVDLTALGKHGEVYTERPFACLAWSHSETRLLYVAEKSRPKPRPPCPWDVPGTAMPVEEGEEEEEGEQFVYHEDWGEALSARSVPVLCALDLEGSRVSVLEGVPEHLSPGQALWSPGDRGVVFVGWWHEPFRLGLSACSNRRSGIFHLDLGSGRCELLSAERAAACSPRLSPDGHRLLYLEGDLGGPHRQCLRLRMLTWQTRQTVTVLDVVQEPTEGERGAVGRAGRCCGVGPRCRAPTTPARCSCAPLAAFAGIYAEELPPRCWAADSRRAVLGTPQRSRTDLLLVDTEAATVTSLTAGSPEGHWELLTLQWDLLVAACSAPHRPPSLVSRAPAPPGWHGKLQLGTAWHGTVWRARHSMVWHSTALAWNSAAQNGMAQPEPVCHSMAWGCREQQSLARPRRAQCGTGQGGGSSATGTPGAAPLLGAAGGCPNRARHHLEDLDGCDSVQRAEPPCAWWPPRRLRCPLAPEHGRIVPAGLRRAAGELPRLPGLRPGRHHRPARPRGPAGRGRHPGEGREGAAGGVCWGDADVWVLAMGSAGGMLMSGCCLWDADGERLVFGCWW